MVCADRWASLTYETCGKNNKPHIPRSTSTLARTSETPGPDLILQPWSLPRTAMHNGVIHETFSFLPLCTLAVGSPAQNLDLNNGCVARCLRCHRGYTHPCHGFLLDQSARRSKLTILGVFGCLWRLCQEGKIEDGGTRPPGTHYPIFKSNFSSRLSIYNFSDRSQDGGAERSAYHKSVHTFAFIVSLSTPSPYPPRRPSQIHIPRVKWSGNLFQSRTPRQPTALLVIPNNTQSTLTANRNHYPTSTRTVLRPTTHLRILLLVCFLPNTWLRETTGLSTPGAIGTNLLWYGQSPDPLQPYTNGDSTGKWPIR